MISISKNNLFNVAVKVFFKSIPIVISIFALYFSWDANQNSRSANDLSNQSNELAEKANTLAAEANENSEAANKLAKKSNLLSEKSLRLAADANINSELANKLGERTNLLSEKAIISAETSNKLTKEANQKTEMNSWFNWSNIFEDYNDIEDKIINFEKEMTFNREGPSTTDVNITTDHCKKLGLSQDKVQLYKRRALLYNRLVRISDEYKPFKNELQGIEFKLPKKPSLPIVVSLMDRYTVHDEANAIVVHQQPKEKKDRNK